MSDQVKPMDLMSRDKEVVWQGPRSHGTNFRTTTDKSHPASCKQVHKKLISFHCADLLHSLLESPPPNGAPSPKVLDCPKSRSLALHFLLGMPQMLEISGGRKREWSWKVFPCHMAIKAMGTPPPREMIIIST